MAEGASGSATSPGGDPLDRPLWRGMAVVQWVVVLEAMLVLALAPTAVLLLLLERDLSNIPLLTVALVPVGPALSAALFAWRAFLRDRDSGPARQFVRGYRLGAVDALRVWVPGLLVLAVLGTNLAYADVSRSPDGLWAVHLVLGLGVVLWMMGAVVVGTFFSFRWRDQARLALWGIAARPLVTLGRVSVLVLATGAVWFGSDAVLVLLASLLTVVWLRTELPLVETVRERFTSP